MKRLFLISVLIAHPASSEPVVANPDVPCWLGEPTYGEAAEGFVSWDTKGDFGPYLITHDRDQFRQGGALEEDYNFIVYWFGNPATPIQARHYLKSDEVSIILLAARGGEIDLAKAKEAIPSEVMCYLQKRFSKIDVLTSNGYEEVWSVGDGDD